MTRFFNERIGAVPSQFELQLESVNHELRNAVWYYIYNDLLRANIPRYGTPKTSDIFDIHKSFWVDLLHKGADDLHIYKVDYLEKYYRKAIFEDCWTMFYAVLDAIILGMNQQKKEFRYGRSTYSVVKKTGAVYRFSHDINLELERYNSAYRIINGQVAAISDINEIETVTESLRSPKDSVRRHIEASVAALSSVDAPDYRTSVKEAISAVEAICRILTGTSTLDRALKKVRDRDTPSIPCLKRPFRSFITTPMINRQV